ncbi:hypothetical protein ACTD5D_41120 [Nocardia takedensis]|uniref:hypothetical protein n=1 Tax=Nocardia takedensis TaxID=259390 RepID=UPI003F7714AD
MVTEQPPYSYRLDTESDSGQVFHIGLVVGGRWRAITSRTTREDAAEFVDALNADVLREESEDWS